MPRRLDAWVARGEPLTPEDGFLLGLVPLMENDTPLPAVVAQGIVLARALPADIRAPVLESMQAVASSRGDETDRAGIREVLRTMPLPQELYRDLRKEFLEEGRMEGREEGRAEGERGALLEARQTRFGAVPEAVRCAVTAQKDPTVLYGWLRAAIQADTLAAATSVILSPRA